MDSDDYTFFVANVLLFIFVKHLPAKELIRVTKSENNVVVAALITGFFYALGSHFKRNYSRAIYDKYKKTA